MNIKEHEEWKDGNELPLCKECFNNETSIKKNSYDSLFGIHNYKCLSCGCTTITISDKYCCNCGRKIVSIKK